ncbi:hypothetical protein RI367_002526 [Sorochytrium milnesiophthora]
MPGHLRPLDVLAATAPSDADLLLVTSPTKLAAASALAAATAAAAAAAVAAAAEEEAKALAAVSRPVIRHGSSDDIHARLLGQRTPQPSHFCSLYSGATFRGVQCSGRTSNDVEVSIQHVDLSSGTLCGYLTIHGLAVAHPVITTYFDAEIIGKRHSFLTRRWGADEQLDRDHWMKFFPFHPYEEEHFLVPDHRRDSLEGASFAGFYYVMMQLSTGQITGYYFHTNCERYQRLDLQVAPTSCFASFEFR